jgi:hypothetical protein
MSPPPPRAACIIFHLLAHPLHDDGVGLGRLFGRQGDALEEHLLLAGDALLGGHLLAHAAARASLGRKPAPQWRAPPRRRSSEA